MLLVTGLLAAGNLWVTAARSLIPLAVDARVLTRETRPEKHPGIDDVYLLHLVGGATLQVDQAVYDLVDQGDEIGKPAWSRRFQCGGKVHTLRLSTDFHGMLCLMPATLAIAVLLVARSNSQRAAPGPSS